ncbi:MAG: helix-turn-helix domain-containing protein [Clostridia bacterium]|nr:helix-turn-helix domain-containing protein [Clostridia bacterium]
METKLSKKEQILDAALKLFADRGYDGVGVDEIADSVGIKGPALYHYFKGKEALLDTLIDQIEAYYCENFGTAEKMGRLPETMEEFIAASQKRLQFTLHDERIRNVRRMMAMEQFRNRKIAALTSAHQLEGVMRLNRVCIEHLIACGQLKDLGSEMMALEYTAPVSLLIQHNDREPEREAEFLAMAERHMRHFAEVYGTGR